MIAFESYGTYGGFENFNGDPWLYKTDGNRNKLPNDPTAPFLGYLQSVNGARSSCSYFSLWESLGVGAIIKNYADQPDYAADWYRKMFAAEVMGKGMGRQGGIGPGRLGYLDWGKIEGLGSDNGDLHNGFYYERTKPDGSVVTTSSSEHPQVDYDWLMACDFTIGFCMTDGCIPFDDRAPTWGVDPTSNDYPFEPQNWKNSTFEAAYRYSQCDRTEGQPWQSCRYRFAGSQDWIDPPTDGTSILHHASAFGGPYGLNGPRRGRPDVRYRIKNNAIDFWGFDASQGKHESDTIIIQPVPNKEFPFTLRGCTLRQFRETL